MPSTISTEEAVQASFARLRDRSWGVRVFTGQNLTGQTITITRRDGTTTEVALGERVALYRSQIRPALYRINRQNAATNGRRVDAPSDEADTTLPWALPVPQETTRAGRMLIAGGITATVTAPGGEHVTIRVKTRRRASNGRWARAGLLDSGVRTFVDLGHDGAIRAGEIIDGFRIRWSRSVSPEARLAVVALFASAGHPDNRPAYENAGWAFQVADRCGRCGRELTDPESIQRGIGPECFGQATSSHAAPLTTSELIEQTADALTTPAPTPSLIQMAADVPATNAVQRDRELIERALRYYAEDEHTDDHEVERALATFDRLAGEER
jgi:hypothetical protein